MTTEIVRVGSVPPVRWACPACFAVVPKLSEVRYELGDASIGPVWRCEGCVADLRTREAASARGEVASTSEYLWALRVGTTIEGAATRTAPRTSAPARSVQPRRSRGGIAL